MKVQIREEPKILAAAERQMQAWARTQEIKDHQARDQAIRQLAKAIKPYLTISREAGAYGPEIAGMVGQKLGWEVFDKNLLDNLAERFHLNRGMLDVVDETQSNWVYDVLGTWMDPKIVPHEKYVCCLGRVIHAAARVQNCIFVGRGAQFLLPRERGLRVRIVAPERYRIAQVIKRQGLKVAEARKWMEETDRGRREFVERFFHHNLDDPHLYDLVINTENLGIPGAVDLIVAAAQRLGA
jgi:cytidylate kinase